jgi:hypothetical protein
MSRAEINPAPEIYSADFPSSKWEREQRAFLDLLPSLLAMYRGKFVAIHDGKVVGVGDDQAVVALDAYAKCGYVPIFVGLVTNSARRVARMPSPRVWRPNSL